MSTDHCHNQRHKQTEHKYPQWCCYRNPRTRKTKAINQPAMSSSKVIHLIIWHYISSGIIPGLCKMHENRFFTALFIPIEEKLNITSISKSFQFENSISTSTNNQNSLFSHRFRENIVIPNILGGAKIKTNEEKMIEGVAESCFFKSFMACVLGNITQIHFSLYIEFCTFF